MSFQTETASMVSSRKLNVCQVNLDIFNFHLVPHFSINSALEKLDSALDLVANSLTPRSAQYFQPQFYPVPSTSNAFTIQNQNWTCSKCTQLNTQSGKRCVWCDSEKDIGKILNRNHRNLNF